MTPLTHLSLTVDGQEFLITCDDTAPRTLSALVSLLPLPLQLHTPKIAGSHIYWHAPLIEDVEGAVDVLDAPPGAFIYWPVRQFLEVTYAPLQAETAAVTILGQVEGPISRVADLAQSLREGQGRRLFAGTLALAEGGAAAPVPSPLPADLVADCRQIWFDCPVDIRGLTQSRALMHPAGPVFAAESEGRVLHETLWRVRQDLTELGEEAARTVAGLALNRAAARIRDFCHLAETPDLLFRVEAALRDKALPLPQVLDLAIATSGRIAAWMDLLIPWNDVNEAFRNALDADGPEGGA